MKQITVQYTLQDDGLLTARVLATREGPRLLTFVDTAVAFKSVSVYAAGNDLVLADSEHSKILFRI